MRVLINGKSYDDWTRRDDANVRFPKNPGPRDGEIRSIAEAEAAAAANAERERMKLFVFGGVFLVFMVAATLLIGAEQGSAALWLLCGGAFLALVLAVNLWRLKKQADAWRVRARRAAGQLPPAGASASFSDDAVQISGVPIPWASLSADRLVLRMTGGEDWTDYHVERIDATDGVGILPLDIHLFSNGLALVNEAYRKLIRERLPPGR